jgi:hypothetical protein
MLEATRTHSVKVLTNGDHRTRERLATKQSGRELPCPGAASRAKDATLPVSRIGSEVLSAHASVYNTFNICRHLITSETKRLFRTEAFEAWRIAVGVAA